LEDRYNQEFAARGDKPYVYGLLSRDEVIGFALVFYFKKHHLVVIAHIAIKEPARNFGSFFYFKTLIAQHLLEQGHEIDFAIAEIVTSKSGDPHPVEPQLLIQLLKQAGFKVAHIRYFTPSIREDEYGEPIEAALMILRNERGNRIASRKLLVLLDCIRKVARNLDTREGRCSIRGCAGYRQRTSRARVGAIHSVVRIGKGLGVTWTARSF
jgi:hypothetical protein